MTSESIYPPNLIDGDVVSSSICPNGTSCGAMDDQQCSGGYKCGDNGDTVVDNTTDYLWPSDNPIPDDINKIPIQCNLPTKNVGRTNNDPIQKLSDDQIIKKTTDSWRVEVDYSPSKPVIIQAGL
jgi:hypothetical protein